MNPWKPPSNLDGRLLQQPVVLSPSDLTFIWEECRHCFWLKVMRKIARPSIPMPSIFSRIDSSMKAFFATKDTSLIGLPTGQFAYSGAWVQSRTLWIPADTGQVIPLVLRGKIDTRLTFCDGTGGVCDFKTSSPRSPHIPLYSRQLHAYATCLEHPMPGRLEMQQISRLGLLVFEPSVFARRKPAGEEMQGILGGTLKWIDIPRDDEGFFAFLSQAATVLAAPHPPACAPNCPYCAYRSGDTMAA